MKTFTRWQDIAAAGFLWFGTVFLTAAAEPPAPQSTDREAAAGSEAAASGLVVYLDPVTGQLLPEPPPGEAPLLLSFEEVEALSRSDSLLVEEAGPVSGTIVHLDGRYQSLSVATVGPDGKIRRLCLDGAGRSATAREGSHEH